MDLQKTGEIISQSRKKKGLTQKQLADKLHVSDRAISKWERGAGFPDVSLLTPLAAALDISVLSLLEGEDAPDSHTEITVRDAISVICARMREGARKRAGRAIAEILLALFLLASAFAVLDHSGAFLRKVEMEVPIGVYADGQKVSESTVTIRGKQNTITGLSFVGQFAVACVERTCREGVTARIQWDDDAPGMKTIAYWSYGGSWESGIARQLYISDDMRSFAMKLDDGTIIATDAYYVPLLMLEEYYPLR